MDKSDIAFVTSHFEVAKMQLILIYHNKGHLTADDVDSVITAHVNSIKDYSLEPYEKAS